MYFPNEYFYDEVREGFYISGMMKHSWAAQMQVLDEVAELCRKHDIQWFADCGSLLGAVRHGGFVPWDDDLDICMLRDDYQRFHKYVVPELPDEYEVMTYECGEYWQMITRVVNRSGISFRPEDLERYHGFPYACGIDVFVLDYVAPDPGEEEVRRKLVNTILSIGAVPGIDGDDPPAAGLELIRMAEETCKVKLDRRNNLRKQLYALAEKLSCLYPSKGAKEVVLMPFWCSNHDHKYRIEDMQRVTQIPFECGNIRVPAGYDRALQVEYGDYLKIYKGGGLHNYPLYQQQEDYLVESWGIANPYLYVFQKEDLIPDKTEKPLRLRQRALEFCTILRQIHAVFASIQDVQQKLELLEQCQDGMIRIGEEIEKQEGEGFAPIRFIELYCEAVYEFSEALSEAHEKQECVEKLEKALDDTEQSIREELRDKREILFLSFRSDLWNAFDAEYQKAVKDPDNHVTVMPIPFYDKDVTGNVGEMHFDTKGYPGSVPITDYREYDISARYPDVIYTMNAYDAYNYSYTLPAAYYTSELKKYTTQLIYIPYFKLGEYTREDQKLRQTTRYFVKIPGLMHADKVYLESAEIRELYLEELRQFCGAKYDKVWEEKLEVMKTDEEEIKKDVKIPEEWRKLLVTENGKQKKVVLFLNAVCSLYQYNEKAVKKLKEVLDTFEANKEEVLLIWRPQPALALSVELFDRNVWLEYRSVLEEYRTQGWGILDESEDPEMAIALADAYYGDPDPVMQRCRAAGKPVMIADAGIV
ncbi:MAG: LicD family protein [Lachnospiraceae bacterium]|nr:LicD family protein [Lachnospiraceae bacterium]